MDLCHVETECMSEPTRREWRLESKWQKPCSNQVVSAFFQLEPGEGWQNFVSVHPTLDLPTVFPNFCFRTLQISSNKIPAHIVELHDQREELMLCDSSDDGSQPMVSEGSLSAKGRLKLLPKKVRKQLVKEVPYDIIPLEQRKMYQNALNNEWTEWKKWDAVQILDMKAFEEIQTDPFKKKCILTTRVAYRNKNAGRDLQDLKAKRGPLIKPRARLCIQRYKQLGKHLLRRDSPTFSGT